MLPVDIKKLEFIKWITHKHDLILKLLIICVNHDYISTLNYL